MVAQRRGQGFHFARQKAGFAEPGIQPSTKQILSFSAPGRIRELTDLQNEVQCHKAWLRETS